MSRYTHYEQTPVLMAGWMAISMPLLMFNDGSSEDTDLEVEVEATRIVYATPKHYLPKDKIIRRVKEYITSGYKGCINVSSVLEDIESDDKKYFVHCDNTNWFEVTEINSVYYHHHIGNSL